MVGLETGDLVYLDFINDRTERINAGVSEISVFTANITGQSNQVSRDGRLL